MVSNSVLGRGMNKIVSNGRNGSSRTPQTAPPHPMFVCVCVVYRCGVSMNEDLHDELVHKLKMVIRAQHGKIEELRASFDEAVEKEKRILLAKTEA